MKGMVIPKQNVGLIGMTPYRSTYEDNGEFISLKQNGYISIDFVPMMEQQDGSYLKGDF